MNPFIKAFEPLFREVKEFTYFQHFIHDETENKPMVIGINATAPSLARKQFTIDRINEKIEASNAPLVVVDNDSNSTLFKITLKK